MARAVTVGDIPLHGFLYATADVVGTPTILKAYTRNTDGTRAIVTAAVKVGDYVTYTPATATVGAYIAKSTKAAATHIVAQADMAQSGNYGHVPVEARDYQYDPIVVATVSAQPSGFTTTAKKVSLLPLTSEVVLVDSPLGDDHA